MAVTTALRKQTMQPRPKDATRTPADWPLRALLDLGAVPTAPGCARAWARETLWEWRQAPLAAAAELIGSELITNAIVASRSMDRTWVQLSLASDSIRLVILVRDFADGTPVPRRATEDEETGRGLSLVDAMSDQFGWYLADDRAPGKVVWAVLESAG